MLEHAFRSSPAGIGEVTAPWRMEQSVEVVATGYACAKMPAC